MTLKEQLMIDYINGRITVVEIIERAQGLEDELQLTEKALDGFDKAYEKERQQNERYRKALEFYAISGQGIGETKHGEVARGAMGGTDNGKSIS